MINQSKNGALILLQNFSYIWSSLNKRYDLSLDELLKMKSTLQNDFINNAFGSMFGAFIGDSLGSYCEFRKQPFSKDDLELTLSTFFFIQAMQMPGKGTFNIKPGQFTDDSEMASHMLQALSSFNPKTSLTEQQSSILIEIAQQYVEWYNTNPFDIGITTNNALNILDRNLKLMRNQQKNGEVNLEQRLKMMLTKIQSTNIQSCSNGSLMRITPMAFFISLLLEKQRKQNPNVQCKIFMNFIMNEINMTHGNPQVFESSYAWVELLVNIILRKKEGTSLKVIYENFIQKYKENIIIRSWIEESLKPTDMDATIHQGWAKIAFTYGIKALKALSDINETDLSSQNYISIIKHVIGKAGDSDTNAAIVGGLVGAVLGFKRLPQNYLFKQFQLQLDDKKSECSFRGTFYEPSRQFYKAMKLIEKFEL